MSENRTQLVFEAHKAQSQFAYFQLGLTASAIAFAIHQTRDASLADTPWPFGLAVAAWALSFAMGGFGLDAHKQGLLSNAGLLKALDETPHEYRQGDIARAIETAMDLVGKDLNRPVTLFRLQKWLLFVGALAFIAGHLTNMAATPSKVPKAAIADVSASSQPSLPLRP